MEQYIKKSVVLAEIERKINEINLDSIEDWRYRLQREHDVEVMKNIHSLIDTLEVKGVDSEKKEIIDKACWWLNNNRLGVIDDDYIKEFRKAINN